MLQKRLMLVIGLLMAFTMVLSACAPSTTTTSAPATTEAGSAATAAPTAVPPTTRHGGWLDEIDYSVVGADSAIAQVQAGAIDLFSFNLASTELSALKSSGLSYSASYGGNYSIMLNPAVLKDTNVLNPFSDKKIREAMNWLIDRNYINQEIYGGGSLPKFFAITTNLVDYTGVVDVARGLETKYAYNLDKAKQVVSDEMTTLGATAGTDGKWQYKGKPVDLIFVIRNDGDGTRKPMGDYIATQLESVGFTVERDYKSSTEASPIWIGSNPADGKWNLYTAGWLNAGLTRDEGNSFQQMYAPDSQQGLSVFLANTTIDPAFQKAADDLANHNFTTIAQRHDLMTQALTLSMQDSTQVWVVDEQVYSPFKTNVNATYDLASGIEAAAMYPYNLRFTDKEGGQMKIGTNDLFTEPWNTIGGDNWIWDTGVQRFTTQGSDIATSGGLMGDPYTGLAWPQRIATAEVTAQTGLPISKTLDWVTLKTADSIPVPPDTWVDWDAKTQKFITAAEKFPNGTTAKVKSVVTYPADLFTTVKWHDGSPISVADFIMPTIQFFDEASKDSKIYDPALAPYVQSVLTYYKGFRITSTNPLTIESYSDLYYNDAELDVVSGWPSSPVGLNGENSWDVLAISDMAASAGELAFTADQADAKKIEQMSWVGGPSLDILSKHLDEADSQSLIPYAPTLSQYITAADAKTRYDNLKAWYTAHGHYWIGTGPYYLDKVFTTEKTLVLKNNPDFPDLADRWASFSTPKLATAVLDGPAQVKVGDTPTFDVNVTYNNAPYSNADIKEVKYLLYDATGAVVSTGDATPVADGHYQVMLSADVTSKLTAGSDKIEVAVVPIPVAIPAYASLDFVVVP
jgi:peptide/nickel transport system substrate-binding protein